MRSLLLAFCVLALVASSASAVSICSTADVNGGFSCSWGAVSFSNFSWTDAGGTGGVGPVALNIDKTGSVFTLNFNPNMGGISTQDIHLTFQVSGGVLGTNLVNGGSADSSIFERQCTTSMNQNTGFCSGTVLWETTAIGNTAQPGPGDTDMFMYNGVQNTVWVYKDINVPLGGHNTGFSEAFIVPEPMAVLLIGSGLLVLGMARKRSKKS